MAAGARAMQVAPAAMILTEFFRSILASVS